MEVPEVDPKRLPLMTRLEKKLADLGVGMRAKLISLFAAIKVLPLILLALLAWMQSKELGEELKVRTAEISRKAVKALDHTGKIAVNDTVQALDNRATAEIERMTTDTARAVADFLYHRDADILFAALSPRTRPCTATSQPKSWAASSSPASGSWRPTGGPGSGQARRRPRRGSPPPLRKTTTASTTGRPMALNMNPAPCILK